MNIKAQNDFEIYKLNIQAIFELKKMYLQIASALATANLATVALAIGKPELSYLILFSILFIFLMIHFYRKMNINIAPIQKDLLTIENSLHNDKLISMTLYNNYQNTIYDDKGRGKHHKITFAILIISIVLEFALYAYLQFNL